MLKELTAIPKSVVNNILALKLPNYTTKKEIKLRLDSFIETLIRSFNESSKSDPELIKEVGLSDLTNDHFFDSGDLYDFMDATFSPYPKFDEKDQIKDDFEDCLRPLISVFHYRLIINEKFAMKMIKSVFCGK